MRSLLGLVSSVLLCTAACTAQEPSVYGGGDPTTGSTDDMGHVKTADLLPPDDGKLDPPTLDALTRTTNYLSVPLHGLAKPGVSVNIDGTAEGLITVPVAADGRFCVDVKLVANRDNVLTITAHDPVFGRTSTPIQASIQQMGAAPTQPGGPTVSQNAAIGGAGAGDHLSFERADPSAMIDGNIDTSYGGRHVSGSYSLMTVQLAAKSQINKIKITAAADCPFTAPFTVYISSLDAPSNPKVQPMAWTQVPVAQTTTTGLATFASPVIVTNVSVVWDVPFNASGPTEVNCGSWALGPYYAIAELEAWTQPDIAPLPPVAPFCP